MLLNFHEKCKDSFVDHLPLRETVKKINDALNIKISHLPSIYGYHINNNRDSFKRRHIVEYLNLIRNLNGGNVEKTSHLIKKLETYAYSDIILEKIVNIKWMNSNCEFVYDFTVPEFENYVAEGIIVHNSPYPLRLAREFNRFEIEEANFENIKNAILRKKGKIILNVGLPPQEGKYNESACIKCYRHYTMIESVMKKWRCTCGGIIKKGVKDRVEELSDYPEPNHPDHRPKYLHLIPLAEIIAKALNTTPLTKTVFAEWNNLIKKFGNEVRILVDADMDEIAVSTNEKIADAIQAFRENRIIVHPGGGGRYGRIELPDDKTTWKQPKREGQKSLFDF